MTATITEVRKVGSLEFEYEWTGTADYRLYSEGRYIEGNPISDTSRILFGSDSEEPPPLEVLDSTQTGEPESITNAPRALLQWAGFETAQYYIVEESVSAVWTQRAVIRHTGLGYYHWTSRMLEDVTAHSFRVKGADECGNLTTITFDTYCVRNPAPPRITAAWDQAGTEIDITARA